MPEEYIREEHSIIGKILSKYPLITQEEQETLNRWLQQEENRAFFESINETRSADLERFLQFKKEVLEGRRKFHALIAAIPAFKPVVKKMSWWSHWKVYVAAASLVGVGLVTYVWVNSKKGHASQTETPAMATISDVKPGQFKARLTLDDGTTITLDSAANGQLVQQGNTNVLNKDGRLVYEPKGKTNAVLYNTLTTAKGETYATVLSDGSKVWLNSQSTIRYPVAFSGEERKVEITGEAYFEVAPSMRLLANGEKEKLPFVVKAPGIDVEVLGTHFNINSYSNEQTTKTTLLEGKVRVRSTVNDLQTVLKPGEQSQLNKETLTMNTTRDVDGDAEVAWHNGFFQFNNADLPAVLRQLERWYDVEVVYDGNVPQREVLGKIPRSLNLSQVFDILKRLKVNFRIEGKKIIVSP